MTDEELYRRYLDGDESGLAVSYISTDLLSIDRFIKCLILI